MNKFKAKEVIRRLLGESLAQEATQQALKAVLSKISLEELEKIHCL